MSVEIRRRRGLTAVIALLAGGLAAGYVWGFAASGGAVLLGLGVLLAAIALWYGAAWFRARTPMFVADSTGLRVRLASAWTGVPWEGVDRVEVAARGRVRDGRLLVFPVDDSAALSGARRIARLDAAVNRKLYGAALAVPYGLATTVSVDDLAGELRQLAEARADVVVPREEREVAAPEPDGIEASPAVHADSPPVGRPISPHVVGAAPTTAVPLRPWAEAATASASAVASASASPARREEVTLAMRRETVDGSLALSAAPDDELTEELPEISELRRTAGSVDDATHQSGTGTPGTPETSGGNVSLIIDATTDLSAQAMRKVRRPVPERVKPVDSEAPPAVADEEESDDPVRLGAELRRARESLGLTVEDLADRTRIRPFVIECMEANDFSACGGDFYARGHLRMLARVLGVASEPLVQTYDSHFARTPVSLREVFEAEHSTGVAGMVRGGTAGASWGGLIAAVVILAIVWGVARYFADDPASPTPPTSTSHSMSPIVDRLSGLHAAGSSVPGGRAVGL